LQLTNENTQNIRSDKNPTVATSTCTNTEHVNKQLTHKQSTLMCTHTNSLLNNNNNQTSAINRLPRTQRPFTIDDAAALVRRTTLAAEAARGRARGGHRRRDIDLA